MVERQNIEKFVNNKLPKTATESELEKLGFRYTTTKSFGKDNQERIEYMTKENKGECFIYKRKLPEDELFIIHLEANVHKRYSVSYIPNLRV